MEAAAEFVDIESLLMWELNPRRNDAAVAKVAASIERFGFGEPIVARLASRQVLAGHTRLRAAKMLGLGTVPVRFLDISEHEGHMYALADNKLGELAEWDEEKLAAILSDVGLSDSELVGFGSAELDKMAESIAGPLEPEPEAEPKGEPESAAPEPHLAFGQVRLPMSEQDAQQLRGKLGVWKGRFGSVDGVVSLMLEGL